MDWIGDDILTTAHFTWEGVASEHRGISKASIHGKNDLINNFCIAVPTNEGRCTQCHAGYGYDDDTFAFQRPRRPSTAWSAMTRPAPTRKTRRRPACPGSQPSTSILSRAVLRENGGVPSRKNCIGCHANAGGGDNVKHGDLRHVAGRHNA